MIIHESRCIAIETRYLGPTNTRGIRCQGVTAGWPGSWGACMNRTKQAVKWCDANLNGAPSEYASIMERSEAALRAAGVE